MKEGGTKGWNKRWVDDVKISILSLGDKESQQLAESQTWGTERGWLNVYLLLFVACVLSSYMGIGLK